MPRSDIYNAIQYLSQLNDICPYCKEVLEKGADMEEHLDENHFYLIKGVVDAIVQKEGEGIAETDAVNGSDEDEESGDDEGVKEQQKWENNRPSVNYGSYNDEEGGQYGHTIYYGEQRKENEVAEGDEQNRSKEYENQSEGETYKEVGDEFDDENSEEKQYENAIIYSLYDDELEGFQCPVDRRVLHDPDMFFEHMRMKHGLGGKELYNRMKGRGMRKGRKKNSPYSIRETNRRVREAQRKTELDNDGVWYTTSPDGERKKHKIGLIAAKRDEAGYTPMKASRYAGCVYHNEVEFPEGIETLEQLVHEAIRHSHGGRVNPEDILRATEKKLAENNIVDSRQRYFSEPEHLNEYQRYLMGEKLTHLIQRMDRALKDDDDYKYEQAKNEYDTLRNQLEEKYGEDDVDAMMAEYSERHYREVEDKIEARRNFAREHGGTPYRRKPNYKPATVHIDEDSPMYRVRDMSEFFPPKDKEQKKGRIRKFSYDRDVDDVIKELVESCKYNGTIGVEYKCPYDKAVFVTKNGLAYHFLLKHNNTIQDIIEEVEE